MWTSDAVLTSLSWRRALLAATLLFTVGAAWALHGAAPLAAQQPGAGAVEQVFRRYATRLVVPVLSAGNKGAAANTIQVESTGWKSTTVLVVEVNDAPSTPNCAADIPTTRFGKTTCLTLAPLTPLDVKLDLHSGHVLIYSLSPAGIVDACTSFAAVKNGSKTLETWEREVWNASPGDSLAVTLFASTADAVTSLPARVTGVNIRSAADRPGAGGPNPAPQTRGQTLPLVWSGNSTHVDLFNAGTACATVRSRLEPEDSQACDPAPLRETMVSALTSANLPVPDNGAIGLTAPVDVVTSVDHFDDDGWLSYSGFQSGAADASGQLAFPLAVGDFPNLKSELWVTNQHMTATAQIDILMWDGNGKLKVYKDTAPLCPGAVRMYDVQKIAGTIDPTGAGRGTVTGPPMLALRVESTNRDLPAAPPISGLMILRSDWGVTAYPAMIAQPELQQMQALGRARGLRPYTIVPHVKINVGNPAQSTLLAVQNLAEPATPALSMDFYDRTGNLVVGNVDLPVGGQGLVGSAFIDLGRVAGRRIGPADGPMIPASFDGFVVVRGQQGFGLLGVVAVEVPHVAAGGPPRPRPTPLAMAARGAPGPGPAPEAGSNSAGALGASDPRNQLQANGQDTFLSWTGIILPRWPDPDAPTATAAATRMRPTPGDGTGTPVRPRVTPTPTPMATRDEATPTPGPSGRPIRLLLPAALNDPWQG